MAKKENTIEIGFEDKIFKAADKLRGNMDASEYKHVILGLIFLKYISDKFDERRQELLAEGEGFEEDRDEYAFKNIFWVPKKARWEEIAKAAHTPEIGKVIDDAMRSIESENDTLKGILPKNYARQELDKRRLGEIVDLFTNIKMAKNDDSQDLLGRTYEYCLGKFAEAEGRNAGEFFTPACIVKTLVEIVQPFKGRVYDPCCGSGGMFVQSANFVKNHQGKIENISIYGQESNPTTWKLAKMNLAIRGLEANLGKYNADTFFDDLHKNERFDFVLANPFFNDSDWGGDKLQDDPRWYYGSPPPSNANFAWMQHMIHHLNNNGRMGMVLANIALSSLEGGEDKIRKAIVNDGIVESIITMPDKLFYNFKGTVSLWILNKNKKNKDKILFIDASNKGKLVSKKLRQLSDDEINEIVSVYNKFKNGTADIDIIDFAKVAQADEIEKNQFILTPGRYINRTNLKSSIDIKTTVDNIKEGINDRLSTEIMGDLYNKWFKDMNLPKNIHNTAKFNLTKLSDVIEKANTGADAIRKAPIVNEDTGIRCVRVGDLTNSRNYNEWGFCDITDENFERYKLDKDDIIVGRTSAIGINRLIKDDRPAVYNNGLIRLKINKNLAYAKFIYIAMNTLDYNAYIDRIKKETSTRENMKLNYLLDYSFVLPSQDVQKEFVRVFEELENYLLSLVNYNEIKTKLNEILKKK